MMRTMALMNTHSYLIEYYEKCKAGKILIGKELMTMLEILMADMEDPAYRFDPAEAHKRITFIEKECKHRISPYAGNPILLEITKKALMEAIYGFYMNIEGRWLRRFTEVLYMVGRKNG